MGPIRKLLSLHSDNSTHSDLRKDDKLAKIFNTSKTKKLLSSEIEIAKFLDKMKEGAIFNPVNKESEDRFFFDDDMLNELVNKISVSPSKE